MNFVGTLTNIRLLEGKLSISSQNIYFSVHLRRFFFGHLVIEEQPTIAKLRHLQGLTVALEILDKLRGIGLNHHAKFLPCDTGTTQMLEPTK